MGAIKPHSVCHQASGSQSPLLFYSSHVTVAWGDNLGTVTQAGQVTGCFSRGAMRAFQERTRGHTGKHGFMGKQTEPCSRVEAPGPSLGSSPEDGSGAISIRSQGSFQLQQIARQAPGLTLPQGQRLCGPEAGLRITGPILSPSMKSWEKEYQQS